MDKSYLMIEIPPTSQREISRHYISR